MKIVYYDGMCPLCHKSVNFLIKADKLGILRYSSLQGQTAKKNLSSDLTRSLETIVFQNQQKIYTKTDAVIEILEAIKFNRLAIIILKMIPRFLRDFFYRLISRKRYQVWGKYQTCEIPSLATRDLFLE